MRRNSREKRHGTEELAADGFLRAAHPEGVTFGLPIVAERGEVRVSCEEIGRISHLTPTWTMTEPRQPGNQAEAGPTCFSSGADVNRRPLAESSEVTQIQTDVHTLSKVLAPGLRLGFIVAPKVLIERMAEIRRHIDRQGDLAMECAVAELLEDGRVQRYVRKCRHLYRNRRDAVVEALSKHFGSEIRFEVPAGGIGLWIETSPLVEVEVWAQRALEKGVAFNPGKRYAFSGEALHCARLGYANLDEQEIEAAVKRMALAYSSL